MIQITGTCNNCGQCCGCETAPNRASPFPKNWPEAVRLWDMSYLATEKLIFRVVGHPVTGGATYGSFKIATGTYYWRWVPGHGLCANKPPWGDPDTWEPQCPVLMDQAPSGEYPCGIEGITLNPPGGPVSGDELRENIGCRWLPEYVNETTWQQWITDHPACSLVGTPVGE